MDLFISKGSCDNIRIITRKPWLNAAYEDPRLALSLIIPFKTPCLKCIEHNYEVLRAQQGNEEEECLYKDFNPEPVMSSVSNYAGHLGAMEVMYYLLGIQPNTLGKLYHQNLLCSSANWFQDIPFWEHGPLCIRNSPYRWAVQEFREA